MELKIVRWLVEKLVPYARNARTHSPEQIAQVAGSIAEFDFVNPILVGPDNVIIAGHARLLAAKKLGLDGSTGQRGFVGSIKKTPARHYTLAPI
jgi:hypothetical protein